MQYFIFRVTRQMANGQQWVAHSRWHRKGLPPLQIEPDGAFMATPVGPNPWLRFWAPQRLAWWIAVLFICGSACFLAGSFASNWPQLAVPALADITTINIVFLIGSIFFTSAAGLQLLEAINGDVADFASASRQQQPWRWFAWKPHNAGYNASLVQFIGTLLFNLNTADSMLTGLTWETENILIWTPDIIGSLCFLAASYLAVIEVSQKFWSYQPRQLSWWLVQINLLGSIAFLLAAGFSFFLPTTGYPDWSWGANICTLAGALCFFVASYLMIPELFGATLPPGMSLATSRKQTSAVP